MGLADATASGTVAAFTASRWAEQTGQLSFGSSRKERGGSGFWPVSRVGGHAVSLGRPPDSDVGVRGGDESRFKVIKLTDEMSRLTWNSQFGRSGLEVRIWELLAWL